MVDVLETRHRELSRTLHAYRNALDARPDVEDVLDTLLNQHLRTQNWYEAVDVLEQRIGLEEDADTRAQLQLKLGGLFRDKLERDDAAMEHFTAALDEDASLLEAVEAMAEILVRRGDWIPLVEHYTRQLERLEDDDPVKWVDARFLIWVGIGDVFLNHLSDLDAAIQAYQSAQCLRPNNPQPRLVLAKLYVQNEQFTDAIHTLRELIGMQGVRRSDPELLHELFRLYLNAEQFDQAWCVSNVTVALNIGNDDEQRFNERYLGPSLVQATAPLSIARLRRASHPFADSRIGDALAIVQMYCRDLYAWDMKKTWGLRARDVLDPASDFLFCKIFNYLATTLGTGLPVLYKRNQPTGLVNGNMDPPGLIVGTDMLTNRTQRELAFFIARQLTLLMPRHYLAGLGLPTDFVTLLMIGAITASTTADNKFDDSNLESVVRTLQRLPPPALVEFGKRMAPILNEQVDVDVLIWIKGVQMTASRVGLLMCGDLKTALEATSNDPSLIPELELQKVEQDLADFALSDAYFALRQELGLAIS